MKAKKIKIEYPELNRTYATITNRNMIPQLKGKIKSGETSENPIQPKPINNNKTGRSNVSKSTAKLKGLCGNCDYADTCIYDKPAAGIWHCNEYH